VGVAPFATGTGGAIATEESTDAVNDAGRVLRWMPLVAEAPATKPSSVVFAVLVAVVLPIFNVPWTTLNIDLPGVLKLGATGDGVVASPTTGVGRVLTPTVGSGAEGIVDGEGGMWAAVGLLPLGWRRRSMMDSPAVGATGIGTAMGDASGDVRTGSFTSGAVTGGDETGGAGVDVSAVVVVGASRPNMAKIDLPGFTAAGVGSGLATGTVTATATGVDG